MKICANSLLQMYFKIYGECASEVPKQVEDKYIHDHEMWIELAAFLLCLIPMIIDMSL